GPELRSRALTTGPLSTMNTVSQMNVQSRSVEPIMSIRNLNSGYGSIQILRDVSFDIMPGEILAVIGANGAGKSTLFRTISGLIAPTRGEILLDGANIAGLSSAEIVSRGVIQSPEGRRVFNGMTVEQNLRLGAFRRRDKSRESINRAIE